MKNQSSDEREALWRRKLSEAERAELSARPELELEARLTETLSQIPELPAPSNFTAQVLNAIELEEAKSSRQGSRWKWNWHSLLPRIAVATAVLMIAGIGFQHHETNLHRIALAKNVAQVAASQPPPSLDVLENLDVIQHMSATGHADRELLADLQ